MIYDELNTAFRWYNSLSRQNRFKNACAAMCDFALPSVCNDILPFQIKTSAFGTPTTWKVIYLDGEILVPTTTPSTDATSNWSPITHSGAGSIMVYSSSTTKYYGIADFTTNLNTTMALLVDSINNHVSHGTQWIGTFDTTIDYIASWDIPTQTFTLTAPLGSGTAYNGVSLQLAVNAGTWGGGAGNVSVLSGGVDGVTTWNYSDTLDISSCVAYINKHTEENGDIYLTYNGGSISNCIPKQFDCGKWYSTIEDENGIIFYSEVFEVVLIENADTAYPALDPSLFSAFRFYDAIDKQTRYKSYCESACNFYLIADKSRLLPFMFRASSIGNIQSFKLIGVDDGCENDLPIISLQRATYLGYDYVFYNGDDISDLPCGKFYVQVCDETQCWYSELINLVDMSAVSEVDYLLTDDGDILMTDDGEGITIS